MPHAVIDLGSNTIRLCVYRPEDGDLAPIFEEKVVAALAGYVKRNVLEPEGIGVACEILGRFKSLAMRFVAEDDIHIFATASLRGLQNQAEVLTGIRLICGILPDVLPGEEEARLDFVGASHAMKCEDGVLIDIGGASTEFVRFQDCKPLACVSLPIGCLSLYHRFVSKTTPNDAERKALRGEIAAKLEEHVTWELSEETQLMVGVGGTVRAALKLSRDLFGLEKEETTMRAIFVRNLLRELKHNENHIYRIVNKRIPERALTIYPGLMILNEAVRFFQCEGITVSRFGVREGYLIDHVLKGEFVHADNAD